MQFNLEKIKQSYGETVCNDIEEEKELVMNNLEFLYELGFRSLDDIFYAYTVAFLQDEQKFKDKVLTLCEKVGENYLNILDMHIDFWEDIL